MARNVSGSKRRRTGREVIDTLIDYVGLFNPKVLELDESTREKLARSIDGLERAERSRFINESVARRRLGQLPGNQISKTTKAVGKRGRRVDNADGQAQG